MKAPFLILAILALFSSSAQAATHIIGQMTDVHLLDPNQADYGSICDGKV